MKVIGFLPPPLQVASLPASQEQEEAVTSVHGEKPDSEEGADGQTVHFVLEENDGYMEPCLHFLAVAHTLISFCCIIGYYCLKVHQLKRTRVHAY